MLTKLIKFGKSFWILQISPYIDIKKILLVKFAGQNRKLVDKMISFISGALVSFTVFNISTSCRRDKVINIFFPLHYKNFINIWLFPLFMQKHFVFFLIKNVMKHICSHALFKKTLQNMERVLFNILSIKDFKIIAIIKLIERVTDLCFNIV